MNSNRIEAHNVFKRRAGWVALCMSLSLLAACGGGGGGGGSSAGTSGTNTGGGQTGTTGTAPFITGQPQSVAVNEGGSANFTVVFDGQAPFTFQWLRDGVEIPGATAQTYTVTNATLADNGHLFSIRITNALGTITSTGAALAVEGVGVRTLAGFVQGRGYSDGTGAAARFNTPIGIAVCATNGTHFVADTANHTIRQITSAGVATTLAGAAGQIGYADAPAGGAAAANARFNFPTGVAVDAACANVYVADKDNAVIRKIVVATRAVTTVAGTAGARGAGVNNFTRPTGIAIDGVDLYVSDAMDASLGDTTGNLIRKVATTGGGITTLAGTSGVAGAVNSVPGPVSFNNPTGVAVDPATKNVYVADSGNHQIRMITQPAAPALPVVTTFAGGAAGNANGAGAAALFRSPYSLAFGTAGGSHLLVADRDNNAIRKIVIAGAVVSTYAGSATGVSGQTDGADLSSPGTAALFTGPFGVAEDANGKAYVTDTNNHSVRTIAAAGAPGVGLNHVTTVNGTPVGSGARDGASTSARFDHPTGLAIDAAGNTYVADESNHVIRRISPLSETSTFAGALLPFGTPGLKALVNGTGTTARFFCPRAVAVDGSGNVYVADGKNNAIRAITPAGAVTTLATGFADPTGITFDAGSNTLLVADTGNNAIKRVSLGGTVSTTWTLTAPFLGTAGTVGVDADCLIPKGLVGVATDGTNIYVADNRANVIRQAPAAGGAFTIIAGNTTGAAGSQDGTGAGTGLTTPHFNGPFHIVRSGSLLYIADRNNHVIRKLQTGTNVVTTVLGKTLLPGVVEGALPGGLDEPLGVAVGQINSTVKLAVSTVHGVVVVNPLP